MEHKLILGGAQWLPFARSRIKAMRATGLRYASQQFEVDDVSIKVRIAGEDEYIRISGGKCELNMDTGLVDLQSYNDLNPAAFQPGVLYEASSTALYNAAFTDTVSTPDRRKNPTDANAGQVAGLIIRSGYNKIRGSVPLDEQAAASFSPGRVAGEQPDTWVPDTNDDRLLAKKQAAALCPASIFTGRCRLYVQALYGRPLYNYSKNPAGGIRPFPTLGPLIGNNIAPALQIAPYRRGDDTNNYPLVNLTTSSGVYLNGRTGRHYLLNPSTMLEVYPLVGSPCAESLRKYLRDDAPDLGFTPVDKERIEAYILSTCLPDSANKIVASGAIPAIPGWYMGYGWHWNWDGTSSDIVGVETFQQDASNDAMRSTHHRITVDHARAAVPGDPEPSDLEWACKHEVIEGPINWALDRGSWCLTEPDWSTGMLAKTTPLRSAPFECDAPFYVFYVRNDIKVCRVAVTYEAGKPQTRTITPGYGSTTYGGPVSTYTIGMQSGQMKQMSAGPAHHALRVTCGDWAVSGLDQQWGTSGDSRSTGDKILTGGYTGGFSPSGYYTDATVEYGEAPPYQTSPLGVPGRTKSGECAFIQWATTILDITKITSGSAAIVVPLYDSEAIYVKCLKTEYTVSQGTKETKAFDPQLSIGGDWWIERKHVLPDGQSAPITYFKHSYIKDWDSTAVPFMQVAYDPNIYEEDTVTLVDQAVLVGHAGTVPAVFLGGISTFFIAGDDTVNRSFATYSGTSAVAPVVISNDLPNPIGTNGAPAGASVIVGAI